MGEDHHSSLASHNAHLNLSFWLAAFLFLLAIAIYVLSDDLSWQPKVRP